MKFRKLISRQNLIFAIAMLGILALFLSVASGAKEQQRRKQIVETQIVQLKTDMTNLKERVSFLEGKNIRFLTVTAYTLTESQTDSDPQNTAFMTKPVPGWTVAVSRDLLRQGWQPLKKVWIQGYGVFEIADLMNKRYEERIDICMATWKKARKVNCKAWVVLID